MKHRIYQSLSAALIAVTLAACSGSADGKKDSAAVTPASPAAQAEIVEIERFDRAVAAYPSLLSESRDSLRTLYAPVIDLMRAVNGGGSDDQLMMALASSAATKVFQPDVERLLPDLSAPSAALGAVKVAAERELPGLTFPSRVIGYVTPYSQSVVIADSVVLLGLNHFLGADYEGYGSFDEYVRRTKTPSQIPYQVAEALIRSQYPYDESDGQTVLSRLLYEGAVAAAVERIVPGATAAAALGYDADEMKWLADNEPRIWQRMASEDMLFSVDPSIAHRLTGPAPSTPLINPQAPGRAGRYIGYRIVGSYLKSHAETQLSALLSREFFQSPTALKESGYRP